MKALIALASIALISAPAQALSIEGQVAEDVMPQLNRSMELIAASLAIGDYDTACIQTSSALTTHRVYLSGLTELNEWAKKKTGKAFTSPLKTIQLLRNVEKKFCH